MTGRDQWCGVQPSFLSERGETLVLTSGLSHPFRLVYLCRCIGLEGIRLGRVSVHHILTLKCHQGGLVCGPLGLKVFYFVKLVQCWRHTGRSASPPLSSMRHGWRLQMGPLPYRSI
jgi:hypothetical protein